MKIWYQQPAADWNHALPLGNGHMGAMCFGGTRINRYQLNDDTLWSGGPAERINPDALMGVKQTRELLKKGFLQEAEEMAEEAVTATPDWQRNYEPLCDLILQCRALETDRFQAPYSIRDLRRTNMYRYEHGEWISDYNRELLLRDGVHCVSYKMNGVSFLERASFPPLTE